MENRAILRIFNRLWQLPKPLYLLSRRSILHYSITPSMLLSPSGRANSLSPRPKGVVLPDRINRKPDGTGNVKDVFTESPIGWEQSLPALKSSAYS